MKKFLLITALICGGFSSFSSSTDLLFNQTNFSKGVNTNDLPDTVQDDQVVNAENMWFNKNNGITRRNGFGVKVTTRAVAALNSWVYQDPSGNEWLLVLYADGVLLAGKSLGLTGNNFTITVSTNFSLTQPTDADVGLGKIWFSNKQDGLSWWDGVNFTTSSVFPKAGSVKIWRNRVVLGDIATELSSVRMSGELNGEDWTNNSRFSTSPVSIRIGGVNDGARVYGLTVGLDELVIFKKRSVYGIGGNDQRDFYVRQISDNIGSIYPKTARQTYSQIIFVSNRGLDSYTQPNTFVLVGDPIKNLLDPLAILGSESRYTTFSDPFSQWNGSVVPAANFSTTTNPGYLTSVALSTTDTLSTDFGAGITSSVVYAYGADIKFSTANDQMLFTSSAIVRKFINPSFEDATGWKFGASASRDTAGGGHAHSGTCSGFIWCAFQDFYFSNYNYGSFETILSSLPSPNPGGYSGWEFPTNAWAGRFVQPTIWLPGCGSNFKIYADDYWVQLGTSVIIYVSYSPGPAETFIDDFYTPPYLSTPITQAFYSRIYDKGVAQTSFTNVQLISSYTVYNANIGTVTWAIRNSSDMVNWDSYDGIVSSRIYQGIDKRYYQYVASFSAISFSNSSGSARILIDSTTLNIWTTGYYQEQYQKIIDIGGLITSWGLYTAVYTSSISFWLQPSSDAIYETSQWIVPTNNSTITAPTSQYLGFKTNYFSSAAIISPSAWTVTINWNEGEAPPVPMAMTNQDNYFLFYSTNTGTGSFNDKTVVYEKNTALTRISQANAGGVSEYGNKLTISDAKPTGNIYTLETSTSGTDSNVGVPSNVTFKRIGSQVDKKKDWEYFFFTMSRTDASISQIFRITYYLDGATTTWFTDNIELSTGTFAGNFKSIVPGDNKVESQFIDIKIEELTQGFPYSIHGVRGYGTLIDIR